MVKAYRHDSREFYEGDEMPPAGDHISNLKGDQLQAEEAIRFGKPDGTNIRADYLYVYLDGRMAEFDWDRKPDRHLYEVEISEDDIVHTGDLQHFAEVVAAIRKKEATDDAVKRYWTPAKEGRNLEVIAKKAIVIQRLKDKSDHVPVNQAAVDKVKQAFVDDDEEFYQKMMDSFNDPS